MGYDGGPAANPVHHLPSGRVNQPRAAACIAGRETEGPLYGAAAPGGGGRAGLGAIELSPASQDTELTPPNGRACPRMPDN